MSLPRFVESLALAFVVLVAFIAAVVALQAGAPGEATFTMMTFVEKPGVVT